MSSTTEGSQTREWRNWDDEITVAFSAGIVDYGISPVSEFSAVADTVIACTSNPMKVAWNVSGPPLLKCGFISTDPNRCVR